MPTPSDIIAYESALTPWDRALCETLRNVIEKSLPEATSKVWHAHPVWFLEWNPIVGYSKRKNNIQLLFWSGQSFDEPWLAKSWTFQAAEKRYTDISEINTAELSRWLSKSREIQWDYGNIVKRKGEIQRLK